MNRINRPRRRSAALLQRKMHLIKHHLSSTRTNPIRQCVTINYHLKTNSRRRIVFYCPVRHKPVARELWISNKSMSTWMGKPGGITTIFWWLNKSPLGISSTCCPRPGGGSKCCQLLPTSIGLGTKLAANEKPLGSVASRA